MAFTSINSASIDVGDPLKKDLFDLIKANEDDLDSRVTALATGAVKVKLIDERIIIGSTITTAQTAIYDIEVIQNCTIIEGAIQIYTKAPSTTGSLTIDVKVNTSTNPTGFNSIFTVLPTLNIATCSDYQRATGTINGTYQNLVVGDILRLDLTSIPANFQSFRVVIIGQL